MIKSQRSKRRKIRKELSTVLTKDISLSHITQLQKQNDSDDHPILAKTSTPDSICSSSIFLKNTNNEPMTEQVSLETIDFIDTYSKSHIENVNDTINIRDLLSHWAIQFNVNHNAVSSLLRGLKKHECFKKLPVDCRTLLVTPTETSKKIINIDPGTYYHFGLTAGIKKYMPQNMVEVNIVIGIDGLPVWDSSTAQFYPILAYIRVPKPLPKKVFLVGLYYGLQKPNDSNNYLSTFVLEAIDLLNDGLIVYGIKRKISISTFCCDAPAKAFVLKIKNHTGFSSCTLCTVEGEYIERRVCFPYTCIKSTNRVHLNYIDMTDEDFHNSQPISVLSQLPMFDSVKSFSLDYLHLVCLGTMKKLIFLWLGINKGPKSVLLNSNKVNELSAALLALNSGITSDFSRKLSDIHRWKGTEYRLLLLYTGPIVFKNIISEDCFTNFMVLNIPMFILLSTDHSSLVPYAKQLLDYFVMSFQQIYGKHLVSHNIHGLLHLSDDYENYGPLDNCCTFLFENFMKELKSMVKKPDMPLQQVINRYHERNEINKIYMYNNINLDETPELKYQHTSGPLINNLSGRQYYSIFFNSYKIDTRNMKDCYVLSNDGDVLQCVNIILEHNDIFIIGKKFEILSPFYSDPISSLMFDIFLLENLSLNINVWSISANKRKMMVLKLKNELVAMPILHTLSHED